MVRIPTKRVLGKLFPLNRMNTKNLLFEKTISMRTGAKFRVNQRMMNPVVCTDLGNILVEKLRDYIKSSGEIHNDFSKLLPTFEYDSKSVNVITERNPPSKIYLKFGGKKRATSYILWKKGIVYLGEGNNTLFAAHMVRFLYLIMRRDHPYILQQKGRKILKVFTKEINYSNNSGIDSRQQKGEELLKKMVAVRI